MGSKTTYREKRRQNSAEKYLSGKARKPYVLREDLARGLNRNENAESHSCTCQTTLGKFADTFKNMLHNNLTSTQQPKTINRKQQNRWLLDNAFDSYGNYIFCISCIMSILNVSSRRLHRLRKIKRREAETPTIKIRKDQVLQEQICDIVPPANETNVLVWWKSLEDSSMVELRSPPKLHRGKSNNSKEYLIPRFLSFIDNNSQPNGRRIGSHGPLWFFNSKFNRINAPSANEADKPEKRKMRSLVYEFNKTLEDNKRISDGTAKKWLKTYMPKHAISPRKTDYCETCSECQEQKRRHETVAMRLQQEGNASESEIRENRALAESYRLLLEEHRMDAGLELDHYQQQTRKSRSLYCHFEELQKKEESEAVETNLQKLKNQIIFSVSLDYQQSKLTPHWGASAQPGETYYLRKLSHNIFGIVDHTLVKNAVYVFDERVAGSKNADTTISLTDHYVQQNLPPWARHLCLFMDNGATNKNQFIIQWAMELVERCDYDTIRMCFFVPGHGKNNADRLFAQISHAFDINDVFITDHLLTLIQNTVGPTGICIHADNRDIVNWKNLLSTKYTSLKDIKNYRDFLVKRNRKEKVVVYCKECCYLGDYIQKDLLKDNVAEVPDLKEELKNFTYKARDMSQILSKEKESDLIKMFDKYIDPSLRPEWLPISQSISMPDVSILSPSSHLARQHRASLRKRIKGKNQSK
ncbi:MAG: hypothetical protein GY795_17735 [Desulfobacterales bacterium]|nr:hypothetical protein [Desulfobacterales bacterium]